MVSVQFTALFVGALSFGQLSDTYGRKKVGVATLLGLMISQMLVGLAPNSSVFAAFRGCVGFFAGKVDVISVSWFLDFEQKIAHFSFVQIMESQNPIRFLRRCTSLRFNSDKPPFSIDFEAILTAEFLVNHIMV